MMIVHSLGPNWNKPSVKKWAEEKIGTRNMKATFIGSQRTSRRRKKIVAEQPGTKIIVIFYSQRSGRYPTLLNLAGRAGLAKLLKL
jgi:hypothetical protein